MLIPAAVYVLAFSVVMLLGRDSVAVGPLAASAVGEQAAILVGMLYPLFSAPVGTVCTGTCIGRAGF